MFTYTLLSLYALGTNSHHHRHQCALMIIRLIFSGLPCLENQNDNFFLHHLHSLMPQYAMPHHFFLASLSFFSLVFFAHFSLFSAYPIHPQHFPHSKKNTHKKHRSLVCFGIYTFSKVKKWSGIVPKWISCHHCF